MNQPVVPAITQTNLANRDSRAAFIADILRREASNSTKFLGAAEYGDVIGRLSEVFAEIIGDRKGPYRDDAEVDGVSQRLRDAGLGFITGVGREQTLDSMCNMMLVSWTIRVIEGINASFAQRG